MIIPINITINGKEQDLLRKTPACSEHQTMHGAFIYSGEAGGAFFMVQEVRIGDFSLCYILFQTKQNSTLKMVCPQRFKGLFGVLEGKCTISVNDNYLRFRLLTQYVVRMQTDDCIITAPTKYGKTFSFIMIGVETPHIPQKSNNSYYELGNRPFGRPCLMTADLLQQLLQLTNTSYYPTYKGFHIAAVLRSLSLLLIIESASKPSKMVYNHMDITKLFELKGRIDDFPGGDYRLSVIAKAMFISEQRLGKGFKSVFNSTLRAYILKAKLHQARMELEYSHAPIKQISKQAGYKSTTNFIAAFKKMFKESPAQYRIRKGIEELHKNLPNLITFSLALITFAM